MGILSSKNKNKRDLSDLKDELLAGPNKPKQKNELQELTLKFEALWCLIKERTALTDEDLKGMVQKISADPKPDTKKSAVDRTIENKNCPKCGRACSVSTGNCMYCGADDVSVAEALAKLGVSSKDS